MPFAPPKRSDFGGAVLLGIALSVPRQPTVSGDGTPHHQVESERGHGRIAGARSHNGPGLTGRCDPSARDRELKVGASKEWKQSGAAGAWNRFPGNAPGRPLRGAEAAQAFIVNT